MHPVVRAILQSGEAFKGKAYFDGNGDYLSLADSDDWYFGTGDFSWSARITPTATPANSGHIISLFVDANNYLNFGFNSANKIILQRAIGGAYVPLTSTNALTLNSTYDVKLTKANNVWYLHIDNNLEAQVGDATAIPNWTVPLNIGISNTFAFTGYMHDLEVIKAGATVLDMPFNEPLGATTFIDNTGKTVTTHGNVVIVA